MIQIVLVLSAVAISLCQEVCSPPCGCFGTGAPFDDRPPPHTWQEQEVEWRLYTTSNPDDPVNMRWDLPTPVEYDPSKPTKWLVHGWLSGGYLMLNIKDSFLQNGHDVNVIVVDWGTGAGYSAYNQSASNTRIVGACSAYLASHLVSQEGASMSDQHCIGVSFGGQTCGYMGKGTSGTLGRVSGLDPAGPLFTTNDTRVRLDATDALFMDNIHTNGDGLEHIGLGHSVGHVDVYPNEGSLQPPCEGAICDHVISMTYYRASISEASVCRFPAYPCQSQQDAFNGLCTTCEEGVDCQRMGYYSDTMPGRGSFWLATTQEFPFCQE